MSTPAPDLRDPQQRERDQQIASEPKLAPPNLPPGAAPFPVEAHLALRRRLLDEADEMVKPEAQPGRGFDGQRVAQLQGAEIPCG